MRTAVMMLLLCLAACDGRSLPNDPPAADPPGAAAQAVVPAPGIAPAGEASCPQLVCDAGGVGIHFCTDTTGAVLQTADGRACATNAAITARCVITDLSDVCKRDVAQADGVEFVPACDECQ